VSSRRELSACVLFSSQRGVLESATTLLPVGDFQGGGQGGASMGAPELVARSGELACALDTATLPYRRPCQPLGGRAEGPVAGGRMSMNNWCSVLSPRQDLRLLELESWAQPRTDMFRAAGARPDLDSIVLRPWPPSGRAPPFEAAAQGRQKGYEQWSRLLVSRGVAEASRGQGQGQDRGQETRGVVLSYESPLVLSRSLERALVSSYENTMSDEGAPAASSQEVRRMPTAAGVGASSSLAPWLKTLGAPLKDRRRRSSPAMAAAVRLSGLEAEELESYAEELEALFDFYSA